MRRGDSNHTLGSNREAVTQEAIGEERQSDSDEIMQDWPTLHELSRRLGQACSPQEARLDVVVSKSGSGAFEQEREEGVGSVSTLATQSGARGLHWHPGLPKRYSLTCGRVVCDTGTYEG